jgi:aspartyl-tRNA(Asn)/glutamyl-tRNA(Gln) amidotransferase subunit B
MTHAVARIGLEVHVQLRTRTKLFCADVAAFGASPNTHVCPVCLGLPGALPVTNARAVELAVRAALGLGCVVSRVSRFDRKSYFYPDLPRGYQVTQHAAPLGTGGSLAAAPRHPGEAPPVVRVRRVHLEEDAARLLHDRHAGVTAVDFNRAGVPLLEIVTEPDLHEPAGARAFLERLRQVLLYLDVSDCDMEKGSLRVDANVSVARPGGAAGSRTELKNMNSFANTERALAWELQRQRVIVAGGGRVAAETLLWDAGRGEARSMRTKEESRDYRYFPEPDLPSLVIPEALIERERARLPELPAAREARFGASYGLAPRHAAVLAADPALADYFEAVVAAGADPRAAAAWVANDVLAWLNRAGGTVQELPVGAAALAELLRLVAGGAISRNAARPILREMADTGAAAAELVQRHGVGQVSDAARISRWIDEVLAAHPAEVARCRAGETRLEAFLMGRVMQLSAGRAAPRLAAELLGQRLRA